MDIVDFVKPAENITTTKSVKMNYVKQLTVKNVIQIDASISTFSTGANLKVFAPSPKELHKKVTMKNCKQMFLNARSTLKWLVFCVHIKISFTLIEMQIYIKQTLLSWGTELH